ncbi:MAG: hypothetical protein NVS3B20_04270 [Polyangiales bacterium]
MPILRATARDVLAPTFMQTSHGIALVVEDDPVTNDCLCEILRDEGYETCSASTLTEAREALSKVTPSLMILDLQLGAESGETLLSELALQERAPPTFIFSTASSARMIARRYGVTQLQKPMDIDLMMQLIAKPALRRRPTPPQA